MNQSPPAPVVVRARVWPRRAAADPFPEWPLLPPSRPRTAGICFSGGGTRSVAAVMGQLRGLVAIGAFDRIGYLSAVSGGAWAAVPYVFRSCDSPALLGPVRAPESLSLAGLGVLDPGRLAWPATLDFKETLRRLYLDQSVPRSEVWTRAVAQTFLAPFGLYDSETARYFCLEREDGGDSVHHTVASIQFPLHVARLSARCPFLVVSTTVRWPEAADDGRYRIGLEFTPMYVGIPNLVPLGPAGASSFVGGGYLESFAFGCSAPLEVLDHEGFAMVQLPERRFTLADVVGMTSARTDESDPQYYPSAATWSFSPTGVGPACRVLLTDGGDLENYGVMPLMRRRVERIAVFINSETPLSLSYDPSRWPITYEREIDPFLPLLFGQRTARFHNNQVFRQSDYGPLVAELQAAKRAGRPLVATTTLEVQANEQWGVDGGWRVTMCWVYNDRVCGWEARLTPELRRLIEQGHTADGGGPFVRFPNYRTRDQNPGALIRLTSDQINLLAELSCWNVTSNADVFTALFTRHSRSNKDGRAS